MLDSIYHMTLKLIKRIIENVKVLSSVTQLYDGRHYITLPKCIDFIAWRYQSQTRCHVINCKKTDRNADTVTSLCVFVFTGPQIQLSRDMRFPTIWYVQPAKAKTSLRIRAV